MAHFSDPVLKKGLLAFIIFALVVFIALIYQMQRDAVVGLLNEGFNADTATIGPYYEVTRVVDGDTLIANIEGTEDRIRLIGIDTPEAVDPRQSVECFGKEASDRLKDLAEGELVRLEQDDSQGTRDSYGRMLAYVYLQDGVMLNRKMIAEGYAHEYTYMTPYKYRRDFRTVQNIAKLSSRGLWSPNACPKADQ